MKHILLALLLAAAATTQAKVKLPALFGDNMVLQQQRSVRIWGSSDQHEVSLVASWNQHPLRVAVKDGHWSVEVPTPVGSFEPQTLGIADADSKLELKNLLIGEVWICSGQSNMVMPLKGFSGQPIEGAMQALLDAPRQADRIRMLTLPMRACDAPQYDFEGRWEVSSPRSVLDMSATAYFFAHALTDALNVPVGIINASWGGSKIEAWMSAASLVELGYDIQTINADTTRSDISKCSLLYNGMTAPVAGFSARGFAWYQGESNITEAATYARLMQEMVAYWRAQWADPQASMPFLYVQIAPYAYDNAEATTAAELVEAQSDAQAMIPNSAMIPTTDIGQCDCIHPAHKRPIGERLAAEALVLAYAMTLPDCSAVRFRQVEYKEDKALVLFDNASNGLTPRNGQITGFEIAGKDGVFHPAAARALYHQPAVELSAPQVPEPTAVRYAFRNCTSANLINTLGWPVIPFRTDRP